MLAQRADLLRRNAGSVDKNLVSQPGQRNLLQLPLVDDDRRARNLVQELLRPRVAAQHRGELRRADPLGALAQQQNFSAGPDDVVRGVDALERLVEGEVERMSGGAGNGRVEELRHPRYRGRTNEVDSRGVGRLRRAGKDAADGALLRKRHVQQEVVARHAHHLQQLGVQRVTLDGSLVGQRLAHEARRVQHLDRLLGGQAGRDQLAPAGETQHPVRLDEAQRDVQIGIQEAPVDVDRRSAGSRAQRAMVGQRARIVVDDSIARGNLGAEDGVNLFGGRAAVQAGRN